MPEVAREPYFREETPATSGLDRMSLLDHLEELRRRIIRSVIGIAIGFGVAWSFSERLFKLMERPIIEALQRNNLPEKLVYTSPTEPFNIYLKVGLIGGIFLAAPIILHQVWMFISPGLYRNERRYVFTFLLMTVGLFLSGGYFGYRWVYPAALDFLVGYGKEFQPMITITEYTNLFMTVILGLAVVFEMPVVIGFLALMGVVTPGFLWRNFRYAVLAIFMVSAILTPTTDILNLMVFAGPMLVLYLFSIGLAWLIRFRRNKAKQAREEA